MAQNTVENTITCQCHQCFQLGSKKWTNFAYKGHLVALSLQNRNLNHIKNPRNTDICFCDVCCSAMGSSGKEWTKVEYMAHVTAFAAQSRGDSPVVQTKLPVQLPYILPSRDSSDVEFSKLLKSFDAMNLDDGDEPADQRGYRERHRNTRKAHSILEAVRRKVALCLEQLSNISTPQELRAVELQVAQARQSMLKVRRSTPSIDAVKLEVANQFITLDIHLEKLHTHLDVMFPPELDTAQVEYNCDDLYNNAVSSLTAMAQVVWTLGLLCRTVLLLSRQSSDFFIRVMRFALALAFANNRTPTDDEEQTLFEIPTSIRSIVSKFGLEGKTTTYAVCPNISCFCTYKPTYKPGLPLPIYPSTCSNSLSASGPICGEYLLKSRVINGTHWNMPIKPFIYHNINDWIARILTRGDLEKYIDNACDEALSVSRGTPPSIIANIFHAAYIQGLRTPEGDLFIDRGSECRLLFSLNFDFFNINRVLAGGASTSCGIIAMACLNLPPGIRYKQENIYLAGIIPGPKAPDGTASNHFFRPLVDDLCTSWNRGFRFSRTASSITGRVVKYAVVPFVMDLQAARKATAMAQHNGHHFCSRCTLHGKADPAQLRVFAEAWRDATSNQQRKSLFVDHGIRYSEFWQLKYFDPTCQLVPDFMHCGHENLPHTHFHDFMDLSDNGAKKQRSVEPSFYHNFSKLPEIPSHPIYQQDGLFHNATAKEKRQVNLIHNDLTAPMWDRLESRLWGRMLRPLKFVCNDLGLPQTTGRITIAHCVKFLLEWHATQPLLSNNPNERLDIGTALDRIREVIRDTNTPSWLGSVPSQFGAIKEGKPGADEWHVLSTVYIPIALISVWATGDDFTMLALEHTMHLVCAIRLASSHTTSTARQEEYLKHISRYVEMLPSVFPSSHQHLTNTHMAFHVYDFLKLYGPVHAWWCYPFERVIGKFQKMLTNSHFGQLESTITHSFILEANLRRWMAQPNTPNEICGLANILDNSFAPRTKGMVYNDDASFLGAFFDDNEDINESLEDDSDLSSIRTNTDSFLFRAVEKPVPHDLAYVIHGPKAQFQARLRRNGVIFSTAKTHHGNCNILYFPTASRKKADLVPGHIEYIYTVKDKTCLVVKRLRPASPNISDPFSKWSPAFPAQIYSSIVSEDFDIIHPSNIKSHFAQWAISQECCVVLSLSRED